MAHDNNNTATTIIKHLFATAAFEAAPVDRPFWYTSGLFGPYYINTHHLIGSRSEANALLDVIEEHCADEARHRLGQAIGTVTSQALEMHEAYRDVIDALVERVSDRSFDVVSGGERRDWFFSLEVARRLNKPHIYIFKDGTALYEDEVACGARAVPVGQVSTALHVADLITQASSYERVWLPALSALGVTMCQTIAVVDRAQGGLARLKEHGVPAETLVAIDDLFFARAEAEGLISAVQREALLAYAADDQAYVRTFLIAHPTYLDDALSSNDRKTRERALRLRERLQS